MPAEVFPMISAGADAYVVYDVKSVTEAADWGVRAASAARLMAAAYVATLMSFMGSSLPVALHHRRRKNSGQCPARFFSHGPAARTRPSPSRSP
jgi:hypothetical protein